MPKKYIKAIVTSNTPVIIEPEKVTKGRLDVLASSAYSGIKEAYSDPEYNRRYEDWFNSGGYDEFLESARKEREAKCAS